MRYPERVIATLCVAFVALQAPAALAPSADNFRQWSQFIRPSEKESAYRRIAWRTKFWPAVEEARKLGRPLLLWTMNGHPLGCT